MEGESIRDSLACYVSVDLRVVTLSELETPGGLVNMDDVVTIM